MFCKLFRIVCLVIILRTLLNNLVVTQECEKLSKSVPNLTVIQTQTTGDLNNSITFGENFIDVKVDAKLHLKCESNEPNEQILWIMPYPHFDEIPEHIEIVNYFSNESNKWMSELIIHNFNWKDVGYYSCHQNNSDYDSETIDETSSHNSVYVFMNSSKPTHLFATDSIHDYPFIAGVVNKSMRINCRPTSRAVNMSLWKYESEDNYTKLDIGYQYNIIYDPKIGFEIDRFSLDKIVCLAQFNDIIQNHTINFQFSAPNPYYPEIDDNSIKYAFVGDNFTLRCFARTQNSMKSTLEWQSKNMCTDTTRLLIQNTTVDKVNGKMFISRNLTVINAQTTDEGFYRCMAIDFSNDVKETSHYIKIYERAYINLKIANSDRKPQCLENYKLDVLIDAMPNDLNSLSLNWTKNEQMIDTDHTIIKENGSIKAVLNIYSFSSKDSGNYIIQVNLLNITHANASIELSVNECNIPDFMWNFTKKQNESAEKDQIVLIAVFAVVGFVLLVMSVFLGRKIREERRQKRELEFLSYNLFECGQMDMINPDLPIDEQIDLLPYDNKWEFSRENLKLGQILGQGAFGRVVRAEAYGFEDTSSVSSVSTTVAVKMLKEKADLSQRKALLAELKILIYIGRHLNIVNLVGAVTKDLIKGELFVIVEYCRYGNIRSFLLAKRDCFVNQLNMNTDEIDPSITEPPVNEHSYVNGSVINSNVEYQNIVVEKEVPQFRRRYVTTADLVSFVFQCSKGMEYLASKKLIHRDLAARNVLLADDDVVKICDFGLARDCYNYDNYVKKGEGPLPIKWMAIESMRDKVFTTKSDVWSFGVFCWEIFTLGSSPYPGLELDEEFYKRLCDGYRMDKPLYATNNIYALMKECWKFDPSDRPDFEQISNQLANMMEVNAIKRYEYQLEKYKTGDNDESGVEYLRMLSDTEAVVDEYVDMTTSGDHNLEKIVANNSIKNYDNLKNVRPIYGNTPIINQPMECVPMIQL